MEASTASQHLPTGSRATGARPGRSVVPAIGIGARRRCSRAGCGDPAIATLVFSYDEQVARLVELLDQPEPQVYDLCGTHADRTSPPRGWEMADTRPPPVDTPGRLQDEDTVAVIAAALRGDDNPRRVDVIEGGDPTGAPPRRVTVAADTAAPRERDPVAPGSTGDVDRDPLRAALEELQRVVPRAPDGDELDEPVVPLTDRRRGRLPAPPPTPPPGPPPGVSAPPAQDRPTLW